MIVADLQQLHPLEEELGASVSGVLALRMLYSSVSSDSQPPYDSFLRGMDNSLRRSLQPLDVLYFWQQAGAIGAGTTWMAVFAVDEVCWPTSFIQQHSSLPACYLMSLQLQCFCQATELRAEAMSKLATCCMSMLSHSAQSAFEASTPCNVAAVIRSIILLTEATVS